MLTCKGAAVAFTILAITLHFLTLTRKFLALCDDLLDQFLTKGDQLHNLYTKTRSLCSFFSNSSAKN